MRPHLLAAAALAVLATVTGCSTGTVVAPAPPPIEEGPVQGPLAPPSLGLDSPLPLDPAVTYGQLDNGLTYYVRSNARPEDRAELWLVVDAGSVLEDDDQRGLAHFVEHMAFNGTERFAEGELVDFLESTGMRFGPDVNAFTSFDETVYTLRVPTEGELMEKAFDVLEDWAAGQLFDPEAVDKERGVVLEEWRLGRGAGARIRDRQFPLLFRGSRYAERLPIGEPEILRTASPAALERFYRDWYRPELMALVAVGDFDAEAIEAEIRERFADLEGPEEPRERSPIPVPGHAETLVAIDTDPELTLTTVGVYTKLDRRRDATVAGYRGRLAERLYHAMLNRRLDELRRRPDPPFLWASSSTGGFVRSRDVYVQSAGVREGELLAGLDALLVEIERVDRHGFTAAELERAKLELLRSYEQAFAERDKSRSAGFASEYSRHFLEQEPAPGIAVELELVRRHLPGIGLDELNRLAGEWISEHNRVVLVTAPDDAAGGLPAGEELLAALHAATSRELEPWVDEVVDRPLVAAPPEPGAIVEEHAIPELGVTEWRLSNGALVVLRPTDFQAEQVVLTGFSPGGHSLAPEQTYESARFADAVLAQGGLGEHDLDQLRKLLAGKLASARTYIAEIGEGVSGSAATPDLETMFQLVYLGFTAPRADPAAFAGWKTRTAELLRNRLARPEAVFSDRLQAVLSQDHPRRQPPTVDTVERIDLDTALAFHRDRFADASDFTFVLVGSFEPDSVRPLAERWLAGLPALDREESFRDVGVEPPEGVVEFEVRAGVEAKAQAAITFHGEAEWSREESHLVESLADALQIRLRDLLREDLGATYRVSVRGGLVRWPRPRYSLSISFGADPEKVDGLVERVMNEIALVRQEGFAEATLAKVREQQRRRRETDLRENGFWAGGLAFFYRHGLDPKELLEFETLVDGLTSEAALAAFRRYVSADRVVRGYLLPEAQPGPAR